MVGNVLPAAARKVQLQDLVDVSSLSMSAIHVTSSQSKTTVGPMRSKVPTLICNQAATSFECDGCTHHASYHSLENPAEDAVLKKWVEQESEARGSEDPRRESKRRKLLTQSATAEHGVVFGAQTAEVAEEVASSNVRTKARLRRPKGGEAAIDMTKD